VESEPKRSSQGEERRDKKKTDSAGRKSLKTITMVFRRIRGRGTTQQKKPGALSCEGGDEQGRIEGQEKGKPLKRSRSLKKSIRPRGEEKPRESKTTGKEKTKGKERRKQGIKGARETKSN